MKHETVTISCSPAALPVYYSGNYVLTQKTMGNGSNKGPGLCDAVGCLPDVFHESGGVFCLTAELIRPYSLPISLGHSSRRSSESRHGSGAAETVQD